MASGIPQGILSGHFSLVYTYRTYPLFQETVQHNFMLTALNFNFLPRYMIVQL